MRKAFTLLLAVVGCAKVAAAPSTERPAAFVSVAAAEARDVPVYLEEIGKSVARETVSIQPQVSGPVTQIHFADGATVKKGAMLFTIDPRPFRAQLDSARATLEQARANLDLAEIEFGRVEQLIQTQAISQQDYDARRSAVAVSRAQVGLAEAAVTTAKLNLEHCFIRSPLDGRVGQRQVDVGNLVGPTTALLIVERLDPIYADFTIPENALTSVQRSMASEAATVEARLPDEPDGARVGKLTFLDNAVQDGSGTVKLRATLANADRHFWPGQFVKVRLVLQTKKDAVVVPATAPQTSAKGQFVYVLKGDSTAEMRPVKVGQRQGELVAVIEGLTPGERVITAGQLAVTPGGKVRVEEAQASNDRSKP